MKIESIIKPLGKMIVKLEQFCEEADAEADKLELKAIMAQADMDKARKDAVRAESIRANIAKIIGHYGD